MVDGYSIELDDLDDAAWSMFDAGVSSSEHAFHLPCIASTRNGRPRVRTVVLRGANRNDRMLSFHTDARSSKMADLAQSPIIEWLFYDATARVQLRVITEATVHQTDRFASEAWAAVQPYSRRCYLGRNTPGESLNDRDNGIPEAYWSRSPSVPESEVGRDNFTLVRCRVQQIDWLFLHAKGNLAARLSYDSRDLVDATWIGA